MTETAYCDTVAVQLLRTLPPEENLREFEQRMTRLIMSPAMKDGIGSLELLLERPAEEVDEQLAYNTFIALATYYRHMKDPRKLDDLFQHCGPRFRNHPSFHHFDLLRYVGADLGVNWSAVLQRARDNCACGSPGSYHLFADLTVYHFEHCEEGNVDPETRKKWLSLAEEAVEKARAQEDYPKFRCTQGRLLSLLGRFEEAERLIQSAIDREPSSQTDYVLRIGSYQYSLLMVQERRQITRMKEEMDACVRWMEAEHSKIQDSLLKNIEYLGLFAGIVSFVIGSLSLAGSAAGTSFSGAAGLILVLFGALLGTFSGFTFMLHGLRERRWVAPVIVFAVAALILTGGLILCFNV